MKNNKVVYIHRKKSDDTIFYVGMGNPNRPKSKERSVVWKRTVKKNGYYIEVLFEGLSSEEAFDIEMYLISKFGRRDKGLGSLVNLTDGGEGANGGDNNRGRPVYNIETGEFFNNIKEGIIGSNISVYQASYISEQLNKKIPIADNNPLRLLEDPYPENDRLWESIRQNEVPFEDGFDCVDDRECVAEFTSVEQDALDRLSTLPKRTLDIILMVEDTSLRKTANHYDLGVTSIYNAIKSIRNELMGDTVWVKSRINKNYRFKTEASKYNTKLVPKSFYKQN